MRYILVLMLFLAQPAYAFSIGGKSIDVNPDSPLWKADIAVEKAKLVLTRDPLEKAKLRLGYMEERLEETDMSSNEGIAKAMGNYEEHIVAIEANSKNMLHGHDRVIANMEAHRQRAMAKKSELLGKVNENAKESITRAFDNIIAKTTEAEETMKEDEERAEMKIIPSLANYNEETRLNLPKTYKTLVDEGTVDEDTVKKAIGYFNDNYDFSRLNDKVFTVEVYKDGSMTYSKTVSVAGGRILEESCCTTPIVLGIHSENIPSYVYHAIDNDRDALIKDLIEIGGGKDLITLVM